MVVAARDGRRAFTANIRSGSVTALDLDSGEPRSLAVSTQTEAIGVSPDGAQVWVGSNDQGTVTVVRIAVVLHALAAFILILGVIVHVYAGIWVKGSIRAMTRGYVSRAWLRKHHLGWYREAGHDD